MFDTFISDPANPFNQLLQSLGYQPPPNKRVSTQQGAEGTWEKAPAQQGVTGNWNTEILAKLAEPSVLDPQAEMTSTVKEVDPLAADRNGWNLPKTGKVNTTGAEQRINARAQAEGTGVTATKQADGSLLLTNMAAAKGTYNPFNQNGKSPLQMTSLIEQLRGVETSAEARPIMDNIRATIAQEQAKINTAAFDFASNKLGIPSMEQALQQTELADRADPMWYPGVGDSPITQRTRTQLGVMRGQAKEQATIYLETNLASGMLKSQLLGATEELKRLERNQSKQDTIDAQLASKRAFRDEQQAEDAAILKAQLSPIELSAIQLLNPSLSNDNDQALGLAIKDLQKPVNAGKVAAIKAYSDESGNSLIALSAMNNPEAKILLFKKEQLNNPALTQEDFIGKMNKIVALADSKDFIKNSAIAKFGGVSSPEAKAYIAEQNMQKASTGDATDKQMQRTKRIQTAIELARRDVTAGFMGDVKQWRSLDPEWNKALATAQEARGKTDFVTVMDLYVGSSLGMEAQQKLVAIQAIADNAFALQSNSVFGRPDVTFARRAIVDKIKTIGVGAAITNFLNKPVQVSNVMFPAMMPINAGMTALESLLSKASVRTDPATGLPLGL